MSLLIRTNLLVIFVFACLLGEAFGQTQQEQIREYLSRLGQSESDSARMYNMGRLCYLYRNIQPDSAIFYCDEVRKLADARRDTLEWVKALQHLAGAHAVIGNHALELELNLQALQIVEDMGKPEEAVTAYMQVGNAHYRGGNLEKALEYYQRSLALIRRERIEDKGGGLLNNIGNIHYTQERMDSALHYYKQALAINEGDENTQWMAINYGNIGRVYNSEGKYELALKYLQKGLETHRKVGYRSGEGAVMGMIGDNLTRLGRYREAEKYLKGALQIAEELKAQVSKKEVHEMLARYYEQRGQYASALQHLREFINLKDSLYNQDNERRMAQAELRYEFEKKEQQRELEREKQDQIRQLERENEKMANQQKLDQQSRWLIISVIGVGAFAIIGLILWRRSQERSRANARLEATVEDRTRKLREANEELNTFIYKSSHDLKGPINSIQGLVNLVRMENNPGAALGYVDLIGDKADQLNDTLHRLISNISVLEREPVMEEFSARALVEEICSELEGHPERPHIDARCQISEETRVYSDRVMLKAVLAELIANGFRFRNKGENSWISLSTQADKDKVTFLIEDNGRGIPEERAKEVWEMFYRGDDESLGSGLGLYMVRKVVTRLGGSVKLESNLGQGTRIWITV